jgi:hypothetical protein
MRMVRSVIELATLACHEREARQLKSSKSMKYGNESGGAKTQKPTTRTI